MTATRNIGVNIAEQFQERGYALVLSDMSVRFQLICTHFTRLLKDREQCGKWIVKSKDEIDPLDEDRLPDLGILDRTDSMRCHDNKTTLHYAPRLLPYLRQQGADVERFRPLLNMLGELHGQCELLSLQIARAFGVLGRMRQGSFWNKTRLNEYQGDGTFHIDRAGWTIQIGTSAHPDQELWLVNHQGEIGTVKDRGPGDLLIFPGMKLYMATEGSIKPTIHGVAGRGGVHRRHLSITAAGRLSLQFFCHLGVNAKEWKVGTEHFAYVKDDSHQTELHGQISRMSHAAQIAI